MPRTINIDWKLRLNKNGFGLLCHKVCRDGAEVLLMSEAAIESTHH